MIKTVNYFYILFLDIHLMFLNKKIKNEYIYKIYYRPTLKALLKA